MHRRASPAFSTASFHCTSHRWCIITSQQAKVQADLPGLTTAGREAGGAATADLAGALLRTLTARRGGAGEDSDADDRGRAPKTIAEAYRETFETLLRFCDVAAVENVAPVWARLANCKKGEQHVVLTQELHNVCLSTEIYAPIVTTTLKQMVVSFNFVGDGTDGLTSGCQPFAVSYAGSTHH